MEKIPAPWKTMNVTFVANQRVELLNVLGSDVSVVNAARVSFGGAVSELSPRDEKLLDYLAKHKHFSPFRHAMMQFRICMPEFCARQFYKHVVGIECTSTHPTKDHAWNEISGRYKELAEVYCPKLWHAQHANAKQCSAETLPEKTQFDAAQTYEQCMRQTWDAYQQLLGMGVSREQARIVLPMSFMTEVIWTASLQAIHNLVVLRDADDAQHEIRDVAQHIHEAAQQAFPKSYAALAKHASQNVSGR